MCSIRCHCLVMLAISTRVIFMCVLSPYMLFLAHTFEIHWQTDNETAFNACKDVATRSRLWNRLAQAWER